jgi:hypothetical protein
MKNFLLTFAESPRLENIDTSITEYDYGLNLNVIKGTKIAAVNFSQQATETFTKAHGEDNDSDKDIANKLSLATSTTTETKAQGEASDSDREFRDLEYLSATRTSSITTEETDSDK